MMVRQCNPMPQLDVSGAAIHGNLEDRDPAILLPNQSDDISHLALDIGGSLIKLIYFSRHEYPDKTLGGISNDSSSCPIPGGRLHFVKFESCNVNECLQFIQSKKLLRRSDSQDSEIQNNDNVVIKATGGGAYAFADLFKDKFGVCLDKEDEMDCLVAGANFLLKEIQHEVFTHIEGRKEFVQIEQKEEDLFPYLLVNIGSGVSIIKVNGDRSFERVNGTHVGGGTYCGLGMFMTGCESFDELIELSQRGDNKAVDLLVGDIYGGRDYSKIGLPASTIASSFGKIMSEKKKLQDYRPEDISLSLLRMISYNIGHIAYLNARHYGIKRIYFGGFFIRGNAYTMNTISFAVRYWSNGAAEAMFLRHEGFLGALGAFFGAPHVGGTDQLPGFRDKVQSTRAEVIGDHHLDDGSVRGYKRSSIIPDCADDDKQ